MVIRKHSKDKLIHYSFWNLWNIWTSKSNIRDCCWYPNRATAGLKMLNILIDFKRYLH